jgi:hypothetical protein
VLTLASLTTEGDCAFCCLLATRLTAPELEGVFVPPSIAFAVIAEPCEGAVCEC